MTTEELRSLVTAGLSDQEIADKVGVSARTVLRWRKRAGLPSMWKPILSPCGTRGAWARGCRCLECSQYNAEQQRRLRAVYAALTRRAPASYAPWTRDEDDYLLTGPGTLVERAQALGRTYEACALRKAALRRQEALTA